MPFDTVSKEDIENRIKELKDTSGFGVDSRAFYMRLNFLKKSASKEDKSIFKDRGKLMDPEIENDHLILDSYHNFYVQFLTGGINKIGLEDIYSKKPISVNPKMVNSYENFMKGIFNTYIKEDVYVKNPKYNFGNLKESDLHKLKDLFKETNTKENYIAKSYIAGKGGPESLMKVMNFTMENGLSRDISVYDLAVMHKLLRDDYDTYSSRDRLFNSEARNEKKILNESEKYILSHISDFERKNSSLAEIMEKSSSLPVVNDDTYQKTLDELEDAIVQGRSLNDFTVMNSLKDRTQVTVDVPEEKEEDAVEFQTSDTIALDKTIEK